MTPDNVRQIIREELAYMMKTDRFTMNKDIHMGDGRNIITAQGTGTMIGTEASQKLGFFGKTPKVQVPTASVPSTAAGIVITLKDFGFYES